jgi:hypothetical protein
MISKKPNTYCPARRLLKKIFEKCNERHCEKLKCNKCGLSESYWLLTGIRLEELEKV